MGNCEFTYLEGYEKAVKEFQEALNLDQETAEKEFLYFISMIATIL